MIGMTNWEAGSWAYPACWPALVAVLELELDQDHVAAPPSRHHPGPTHHEARPWPCLPTAPGRTQTWSPAANLATTVTEPEGNSKSTTFLLVQGARYQSKRQNRLTDPLTTMMHVLKTNITGSVVEFNTMPSNASLFIQKGARHRPLQ